MILKVCRKPHFVDINSSMIVLHLLPVILIAHCINSIWTYGNSELFATSYEEIFTIVDGLQDNIYVPEYVPIYLRPI